MKNIIWSGVFVLFFIMIFVGCNDSGTDPTENPSSPKPSISSVSPDSVSSGDVVSIKGNGFGLGQGTSIVKIGGAVVTEFISWTDSQIVVKVPVGALSGSVEVIVGGKSSNLFPIKVSSSMPPQPTGISFSQYVLPVFNASCVGCHGGRNNLFLDSYAKVMAGTSLNGPVVIPGNGEGSYLIQMLRGTVSGKPRMPLGGPFWSTQRIDSISAWIQQGALNN